MKARSLKNGLKEALKWISGDRRMRRLNLQEAVIQNEIKTVSKNSKGSRFDGLSMTQTMSMTPVYS